MNNFENLLPYVNALDSKQTAMTNTLIEWANINSGSFHHAGIDAFCEKLIKAFEPLLDEKDSLSRVALPPFETVDDNGEVQMQPVADALLIKKRPELTTRVLLCGHMDTVYPKQHHFQTCRQLDENTLNGPGVADMKGGLVVMLNALACFEASPFAKQIGWDVYLSSDEELGSLSSHHLFPEFKDHAFAMIFEPSQPNGEIVRTRKGSGNFSVVVRGQSAHAGRAFYAGKNAIVKMADIIKDLYALNNPDAPAEAQHTLNVGKITGGQALNVVPDLCVMRFNIRVPSQQSADALLGAVDEVLKKHQAPGYTISRHGVISRPAKPFDAAQAALFEKLKLAQTTLGQTTTLIDTGGCCDGNNFKALGLANIDTLGVIGGNIHSPDEFMFLDSLPLRAKLSALLLLEFAANKAAV